MLIKIRHQSEPESSEITSESVYRGRRQFIVGSGAIAGTVMASRAMGALNKDFGDLPDSRFNTDEKLTPYEVVTTYNNFYEMGSRKEDPFKYADSLKTKPWSITVGGECHKPGTYNLEDFIKPYSLEDRVYRMRCVEAWSMVIPWVGFEVSEIIKRAEPKGSAKFVAFTTVLDRENLPAQKPNLFRSFFSSIKWPYVEGLRLDEAMNPLAIFSVGLYGKPLPNQNGAPLRLVVPWKYGFKSIKSITKIQFVEKMPPTSWNLIDSGEYGFYSNVNPTVDHPRWSQKREKRLLGGFPTWRKTQMFNGYAEQVASMYKGMDLQKNF